MLKGGSRHRTLRIFHARKTRGAAAFLPGARWRANKVCESGLVLHGIRHMRADGQYKINDDELAREKEKAIADTMVVCVG